MAKSSCMLRDTGGRRTWEQGAQSGSRRSSDASAGGGADRSAVANLSEREFDAFHLIAAGSSNSEIAELLGISPNTVKSHECKVLCKLHLADRTQAAIFAWRVSIVQKR